MFFTFTSDFIVIPPVILITIYFLSNLHLHLHDICFVEIFDSFSPVIMFNTLRFKSSVLFGTHILFGTSRTLYD